MDGEHTGPINIGNPNEFTMLELTQKVKEVVGPNFIFITVIFPGMVRLNIASHLCDRTQHGHLN